MSHLKGDLYRKVLIGCRRTCKEQHDTPLSNTPFSKLVLNFSFFKRGMRGGLSNRIFNIHTYIYIYIYIYIQCTSDIVATWGHPQVATISEWPLYPTWEGFEG